MLEVDSDLSGEVGAGGSVAVLSHGLSGDGHVLVLVVAEELLGEAGEGVLEGDARGEALDFEAA